MSQEGQANMLTMQSTLTKRERERGVAWRGGGQWG